MSELELAAPGVSPAFRIRHWLASQDHGRSLYRPADGEKGLRIGALREASNIAMERRPMPLVARRVRSWAKYFAW